MINKIRIEHGIFTIYCYGKDSIIVKSKVIEVYNSIKHLKLDNPYSANIMMVEYQLNEKFKIDTEDLQLGIFLTHKNSYNESRKFETENVSKFKAEINPDPYGTTFIW